MFWGKIALVLMEFFYMAVPFILIFPGERRSVFDTWKEMAEMVVESGVLMTIWDPLAVQAKLVHLTRKLGWIRIWTVNPLTWGKCQVQTLASPRLV